MKMREQKKEVEGKRKPQNSQRLSQKEFSKGAGTQKVRSDQTAETSQYRDAFKTFRADSL